jgi:hypothetical protein
MLCRFFGSRRRTGCDVAATGAAAAGTSSAAFFFALASDRG